MNSAAPKHLLVVAVGLVFVWNIGFVADLYRFLNRYGGAHGTYGTGITQKQEAVRWLLARADYRELMQQGRIAQVDRLIPQASALLVERPQQDLPFLAMVERERGVPPVATPLPTNAVVLVMDQNRTNFSPDQWPRWRLAAISGQGLVKVPIAPNERMIKVQFGAMWLFVVTP